MYQVVPMYVYLFIYWGTLQPGSWYIYIYIYIVLVCAVC
jgi:hypothetical protein